MADEREAPTPRVDPDANYRELERMMEERNRSIARILSEFDDVDEQPQPSESKQV